MVMKIDKLYFISKCVLLNEKNEILILKRTDYKNDETGDLWDFPGGSVNLGEDVNEAVKREAFEEIQVKLNKISPIAIDSGKGVPSGQFIFVLFYSKDYDLTDNKVILSKEHSEYKWISYQEINNYKFYLKDYRMEKIKEFLKGLN